MECNKNRGGKPRLWDLIEETEYADCRVFAVHKKRYQLPHKQREGEYYVIDGADWVNVVGITANMELILINQFRAGIDSLSLEVPGGMMEAGEDPIEAGIREFREETGYSSDKVRLLGWTHPNPAIQSNRCFVVLAEGVEQTHPTDWDEDEEIETLLQPLKSLDERIAEGEITHALTHVALAFARKHGAIR